MKRCFTLFRERVIRCDISATLHSIHAASCLCGFLSELHALRIDLFLHQQGLDTRTPAGKAMFQMMGVLAEFERAMIQERVRAGLARAKSEGKRLGRPPIAADVEKAIRAALDEPGRPGVLLCPGNSDIYLFRYRKGIIDLDAQKNRSDTS
jgi:hypothetical protein